jgi:hypothetical protein
MAPNDPEPRTARRALVRASPRPCAQCPWRTRNQSRRDRHGFYRLENLRRLWEGLRDGERMTCHPTDPDMAEFAGYEQTAGAQKTCECAGALVVIQRELTRLDAAYRRAKERRRTSGLGDYLEIVGPFALTREGAAAHVFAMLAGRTPLCGGVDVRHVDLNEPGIGVPGLPTWGECELDPPEARGPQARAVARQALPSVRGPVPAREPSAGQ